MYISLEQAKRFINTTQRDPRLNEILHPFLTDDQVRSLIAKYEPNIMLANRGLLFFEIAGLLVHVALIRLTS